MTETHLHALLLASLAGAMIPFGALLACIENIQSRWLEQEFRHSVIAFGGGVLFSAVSLVLVPAGAERLPVWMALLTFGLGGAGFALLDAALAARRSPMSQTIAMLADFVPEAVALGAMFAADKAAAPLLALMIGLQNLPEGFNAYREFASTPGHRRARTLAGFAAMALLGPLAAAGGILLADQRAVTAALMMLAAGGILYLVFEDIAPAARLRQAWLPPLGAVLGFLAGLAGHLLIGGG